VGRPDTAAACRTGGDNPGQTRSVLRLAGAMNQINGDQAGNKADDAGEENQAQVMLAAETGKHSKHTPFSTVNR